MTEVKDLNDYLTIAIKLIKTFNKKHSINNEISDEMIGYVVDRIFRAEHTYDYNKVSEKCKKNRTKEECKKYYLRMHGIYGIRAYLNLKKYERKRDPKIVDYDLSNSVSDHSTLQDLLQKEEISQNQRTIDLLLNSTGLTEKQKEVVKKHIFDSRTFEDISNDYGVKPQAISSSYQKALKKMRIAMNYRCN